MFVAPCIAGNELQGDFQKVRAALAEDKLKLLKPGHNFICLEQDSLSCKRNTRLFHFIDSGETLYPRCTNGNRSLGVQMLALVLSDAVFF